MIVPELTNGEFEAFITGGVVLIDFFAEWCMPCMMMSPIIEDLNEEFSEKAKIGKVNVEDNHELSQKYGIQSIPHFIVFKDGKIVEELSGSRTQPELSEIVKKHL